MLSNSLKLFEYRRIRIEIHYSWLLLGFLVASSLATGWFPNAAPGGSTGLYWLAAAISAVGLLISIALHELSHALVGQHFKMSIDRITLFLFGGVAQMNDEPPSPKAEFWMAIAGPIMSVVLAVVFFGFYEFSTQLGLSEVVQATLSYLASINVVVALFNMLPGFPLDGGRVLRSALWHFKKDVVWATRISSGIGQLFGIFLASLGVFSLLRGDFVSGIWGILLGFMLISFARSAYMQLMIKQNLHGRSIAHFMNPRPATATPETSISELMREFVNHEDQTLLPVVREDGALVGCVDPRVAGQFPENEWHRHHVAEVVQACTLDQQVEPDTDAQEALARMSKRGYRELVVVHGNHLLGVLSQAALIRYLSLRQA